MQDHAAVRTLMTDHIPADPDYMRRIYQRMQIPVVRFIGLDLVTAEPGRVSLSLDNRAELGHAPGWFQGSITTAIAEFAAAWSGCTLMPADWNNLTLDQSINFTGPARGKRLIARGSVIQAGRTVSTCLSHVYACRDGEEHLCAVMMQTNRHAPAKGTD